MRIGLLSDTHIPEAEKGLPAELIDALRGVDLILHAGDIYLASVLDDLEQVAPVLAARGDDDYGSTLADPRVKDKQVLDLEGKRLWLVHQRPFYVMSPWWRDRVASGQEKDGIPDIVVLGHEHRTDVKQVEGILFVNPGSPTFLNYLRGLGTIGILDINAGEAQVSIVQL